MLFRLYIFIIHILYIHVCIYCIVLFMDIYIYIYILFIYILLYAFWSVPILHIWEALSALRKRLNNRMEKYISSDTLCNLAEVVLKNNIFKFGKKKH